MEEKTALITGGTSGIGLATARLFLSRGMRVAIAGRDEGRGQEALRMLAQERPLGGAAEMASEKGGALAYGEARYFSVDVRKSDECRNLAQRVADEFGRIDVLVNSAGVYMEQGAADLTEEDYAYVMDTNLKGTMFMTRYALPFLRRTKGTVVNVSSDAGLHGNYLCSLYCASKGAVTLYTRAVAREEAAFGVRVNCVCPADILTPLTEGQLAAVPDREAALREMAAVYPMERVGTAEEAAAVIAFLSSPAASYVTGAAWNIDGGLLA